MGHTGKFLHLSQSALPGAVLIILAFLAATPAVAEPLLVLSQNMNRLFDDIDDGNREKVLATGRFRQRIKRAAKKFGDHFRLPHIIALQEVENLNVLHQIANEIQHRYRVTYRAILIPGHDVSGINVGYLVRQQIRIKKAEQLFREKNQPQTRNPLFSRPPLTLEVCRNDRCLILLNLHLRSMRGLSGGKDADRIRRKRRAQAETIATWSNKMQSASPAKSILIVGDLNALTPSDNQVDVAGILRGNPNNKTTRLPGRDLLEPDLVDLAELIPLPQRYSFIFRQRKQQLDYMLINRAFAGDVRHIQFSKIDYQFSDHAGLLTWFNW